MYAVIFHQDNNSITQNIENVPYFYYDIHADTITVSQGSEHRIFEETGSHAPYVTKTPSSPGDFKQDTITFRFHFTVDFCWDEMDADGGTKGTVRVR